MNYWEPGKMKRWKWTIWIIGNRDTGCLFQISPGTQKYDKTCKRRHEIDYIHNGYNET